MGTNILLFAFAGHDTTGHTLTWLLFELCRHPQYKQKLKNNNTLDSSIDGGIPCTVFSENGS